MAKLSVEQALDKAKLHIKKGEFAEAQTLYATILKAFPNNKKAQQGLTALGGGQQSAAEQGPPQAVINQLMSLYKQGQLKLVVDQTQDLTVQFPKAITLWNMLGASAAQLGKLDQAVKAFEKIISLNPNQASSYYNLGNALKDQGKVEEAIEAYNRALAIKPDYEAALNNVVVALKTQGKTGEKRLKKVLETYNKAQVVKTENANFYFSSALDLQKKGKLEEAIEAYNKALAIKPEYAEAQHIVASLTGKTTTSAPKKYIENLFDGYSKKFEQSLVGNLEYKIPKLLTDIIVKEHGSGSLGSALDLGCGTGLTGLEIKDFCSNLEGVDLSKKMLELANAKNVYNKLVHTDILDYLANTDLCFDYFIATDVLIYVGDLTEFFRLIKSRNKQNGKLAFSTEKNITEGYQLETSGRYSHSKSYIEGLCKQFDYSISYYSEVNLRKEKGTFLTGGLYLLSF